MNSPLITAIIPTYKRPALLKRAANSVLRQTYKNFTLLISDNASGKETEDMIETFMAQDKRVKCLRHPTNIGAIENFQAAFREVSTPYVCFLPDDDFFASFFFEEALTPFKKHPGIAFSGGGGVIMNRNYEVNSIETLQQKIPPSGYYPPPSGLLTYFRSSFGIAFPPLLFKTEILKEFGGFDLKIQNGADEHLISQCAARYPVFLLTNRPFYFGFQHEGSLSGQINYPLFEQECILLHEHLEKISFSSKEKEEIDQFFTKRHLKILSNAYRYYYNLKDFKNARLCAEKLYQKTHSSSWKRKKLLTTPFLSSFYDKMKAVEKTLRKGRNKSIERIETPPSPDLSWKEYALSLEGEHGS